jgi:Ca2+/Na+ antiporter
MALCVALHATGVISAIRWVRAHTNTDSVQPFWPWTWLFIRIAGWIILFHLIEIPSGLFSTAGSGHGRSSIGPVFQLRDLHHDRGILSCLKNGGWWAVWRPANFDVRLVHRFFSRGRPDDAERRMMEEPEPNESITREIRNPLLWLLAFVPVVLAAAKLKPEAHTLLFILSILAIVPLAALLSHATESVAAKTGDAVGGLLNATLGNLTELIIALAALQAGQYVLVKASVAGAIVTNSLFMLGASFFLGGLKFHVQEYNRVSARLQAGLLFLAAIGLLIPSAIAKADPVAGAAITQKLSVGLALLLIVARTGMRLAQDTHRELFASADHGEAW